MAIKNMMTAEQFHKLPKYAREAIEEGDRRCQRLKDQVEALKGETEPNGVLYSPAGQLLTRMNAPATEFRFILNRDEGIETPRERVDVRLDGDHIYVNGGDSLAIVPEASNSCRIYVKRFR